MSLTLAIASGPSGDANYASHEIGHVLGRAHPVPGAQVCDHSASDPNYPYAGALIGFPSPDTQTRISGLDFDDTLPGRMVYLDILSHYDTMAYCKPNWISDYTTNGIYDFLDLLPAVARDRKSTRLNSSHIPLSRMPSSA